MINDSDLIATYGFLDLTTTITFNSFSLSFLTYETALKIILVLMYLLC